jgi:hypothetical protein
MHWRSAAAGCLIAATGVSGLDAEERVTLVGCPAAGIEMSCLILKEQGGVAYDIRAAKPRPRLGYMAVRLSGTKSRKLGICQQGVILEDIQWSYTKEKCE